MPIGTDTKCLLKVTHAQLVERCAVKRVAFDSEFLDALPTSIAKQVERRVVFEAATEEGAFFFAELADGSDVSTGLRFGDPEHQLGPAIAQALAGVLDLHHDPRGVFVYPDTADPVASGYEERIAELQHVGRFLPAESFLPSDPDVSGSESAASFASMLSRACAAEGIDMGEVMALAKGLKRQA